jgi:hypothetical protein
MALTESQKLSIQQMMAAYLMEVRPPEHIRPQLDIGWRLEKQSVFLFEIRPQWNDETIIRHHDFAKATWVNTAKEWNIFWLRANGKWQTYDPLPTVVNLKRFLLEVASDPYCCFKG